MKEVLYIVLHCTSTRLSQHWTVEDIDRMHKARLYFLLKDLKESYPKAKIVGHRDFPNVLKACPCLDAQEVYADLNAL